MKRLSENRLWDIYKKSAGLEQRKEDKLKPFFGEGIEYKFYEENGRKHFTYKEIYDILKKNPGWRMPTWDDFEKVSDKKNDINKNPNINNIQFPDLTVSDKYAIVYSICGELVVDITDMPYQIWYYYENSQINYFFISLTFNTAVVFVDQDYTETSTGMVLLLRDKNK